MLLLNKQLAEGILQHYSLQYNIALVSVDDFWAAQPVKIQYRFSDYRELLAVGCVFKSRKLMAARGVPLSTVVTHDCKFLRYTTCGITKVTLLLSFRFITQLKLIVALECELIFIFISHCQ